MRFQPPAQTAQERRTGRRMAMLFGALFVTMTVTPVVFVVIAVRNMPDIVRNSPGLEARTFELDLRRDARDGRILAAARDRTGRPLSGVTVRGVMQADGGPAPLVFRRVQPGLYAAAPSGGREGAATGRVEVTAFLGAAIVHAFLDDAG